MEDLFMKVIADLLAVLGTAAAAYLVAWLRKRLGLECVRKLKEELEAKQGLAYLAVQFVEQAYQDLHGAEKYQKAADWLAARAAEAGFKLTSDEIKGLIEAGLRAFKDKFGEDWASTLAQKAGTEEIKYLIGSELQSFKDKFREDWAIVSAQKADTDEIKCLIEAELQAFKDSLGKDWAGQKADAGEIKGLIQSELRSGSEEVKKLVEAELEAFTNRLEKEPAVATTIRQKKEPGIGDVIAVMPGSPQSQVSYTMPGRLHLPGGGPSYSGV